MKHFFNLHHRKIGWILVVLELLSVGNGMMYFLWIAKFSIVSWLMFNACAPSILLFVAGFIARKEIVMAASVRLPCDELSVAPGQRPAGDRTIAGSRSTGGGHPRVRRPRTGRRGRGDRAHQGMVGSHGVAGSVATPSRTPEEWSTDTPAPYLNERGAKSVTPRIPSVPRICTTDRGAGRDSLAGVDQAAGLVNSRQQGTAGGSHVGFPGDVAGRTAR